MHFVFFPRFLRLLLGARPSTVHSRPPSLRLRLYQGRSSAHDGQLPSPEFTTPPLSRSELGTRRSTSAGLGRAIVRRRILVGSDPCRCFCVYCLVTAANYLPTYLARLRCPAQLSLCPLSRNSRRSLSHVSRCNMYGALCWLCVIRGMADMCVYIKIKLESNHSV